jgi:hypothetical protein
MTQTAPKSPATKTYYANVSPGSGDGPVLTLDRALCQGHENVPVSDAAALKALIAARNVARVMIADSRFPQRGYATPVFRAQPGRKAPALLDEQTIAKLWR